VIASAVHLDAKQVDSPDPTLVGKTPENAAHVTANLFATYSLPVVPGLYRVDLAIEAGGLEIDLRQRCATLRVEPGRIAYGDFHIDNTWNVIEAQPNVSSAATSCD